MQSSGLWGSNETCGLEVTHVIILLSIRHPACSRGDVTVPASDNSISRRVTLPARSVRHLHRCGLQGLPSLGLDPVTLTPQRCNSTWPWPSQSAAASRRCSCLQVESVTCKRKGYCKGSAMRVPQAVEKLHHIVICWTLLNRCDTASHEETSGRAFRCAVLQLLFSSFRASQLSPLRRN